MNTERYGVSLRIQSECGKIRTRITPNTDTFLAVFDLMECKYVGRNKVIHKVQVTLFGSKLVETLCCCELKKEYKEFLYL